MNYPQMYLLVNELRNIDAIDIIGGRSLHGEIIARGAKNSVPKIMVAALLTNDECIIHNVPEIEDVEVVTSIIKNCGGSVKRIDDETLVIKARSLEPAEVGDMRKIAAKSRIPILLAGPLLSRAGKANIPMPGGCEIGLRPIDFHLNSLEKFGAKVKEISKGYSITSHGRLSGQKIHLDYPSVGATEQVLLNAVMAKGVTEVSGAAVEPEIIDLICVLQKMGAIITVKPNRVISIVGVEKLHGFEHRAMTDRIEVASWACAAAMTDGRIFVRNATQIDMMTFLNKFRQIGGEFLIRDDGIEFWRGAKLHPLALETDVHPGFMTDWQQPFTLLLTQADGLSIVHETVYEDRFGYVETLNTMGAQIQLYQECLGSTHCRFEQRNYRHSAVIKGPTRLHGADIIIPDLRAGFSYVIAALGAEGESTVRNVEVIARGYERLIDKLKAVGADIISVR